jgi:hypothetical protein
LGCKFPAILCQGGGVRMKKLFLVVLLMGVTLFVGCGGSGSNSSGGGGNTAPALAITPAAPSISVNATQQFKATASFNDGTTKDLTGASNWLSSNGAVATINAAGLATALAPGTTTITASSAGVTATTTLTVANPLVSIAVTPNSVSIAPKATQQFTAVGTFADGTTQPITSTVTWSASPGATITSGGLATATTPNSTVTIMATQGSIAGTAALTVTSPVTSPLVSIAVTPPSPSIAPNATQQFTAVGTFADGTTQPITSTVTWSASPGATITSGGLATATTPNSTVTIMATQGSIAGTAVLTVTNPLVSIAVTPPSPSIAPGTKQQFVATGTYADNSTGVITSTVTWASSNQNVATISNSRGTNGLATSVAPGTTLITAQSGSIISPPATLTVTSATLVSIAVTPIGAAIALGNQQQYTATGTYSDSTTQDITNTVTWASFNPAKISITVSGLATGVATTTSPVTISATQSSITGNTTGTVIPPTLVSIAIKPNVTTMAQGTSRQYIATGTETNGSTLNVTNLATWTSNAPTIAGVGQHTGMVQAATSVPNPHNAVTITAKYSGVTQTLVLDVTNATPQTITVTPIAPTIPAGVNQKFNAVATFSDSTTQDVSSNSTWQSSDATVATVNFQGVASGVKSGPATITATFGGQSGSAMLTVSTATLVSIAVTPAQTVLAPASTVGFQAIGTYSDQSTQNLTGLATWTTSDPSVVAVVATGLATGQSAGTATITATYQSIPSTSGGAVIVTSSPLASIAVTPSAPSVPEGVSVGFQATGTFADQTKQTLTSNVTWASGRPAVAIISNAPGQQGAAIGVSAGQTAITAVFAGIVGNANLTVTNATIVSIAVAPANANVSAGTQVSYTAKGTFSDQSVIDLTNQVTWSSSVATVATINSPGLASTANPGVTVISAAFTQNGTTVTGMTNLTVH